MEKASTASVPTASYGVATECAEGQAGRSRHPTRCHPKEEAETGRVKGFFKTVLKSVFCFCLPHGDLD
ncbi:unnamed protein product [Arctogadus glacialis]